MPPSAPPKSFSPTALGAEAIALHQKHRGKISIAARFPVRDRHALALAYTPGVADVCLDVQAHPDHAYSHTCKGRLAAVVSDGTRVLGLGNIGPLAALPVMEGKSMLLKEFGGVDAVPLCLRVDEKGDEARLERLVRTVEAVAPSFGAILLEDIESPLCFELERRLESSLDIPVFHDDQHGTAIVALAGLINALALTGRNDLKTVRVVVNGAGAAGVAIARLLLAHGLADLSVCDSRGALAPGREGLEPYKLDLIAALSAARAQAGLSPLRPLPFKEALRGADVFIGVSAPGILKADDVRSMASQPIVFALCNPTPEISGAEALAGGAAVYGSGRSDTPNQINNVLAFPGLFAGLLSCRARRVSPGMKLAAARAIAALASSDGLTASRVVPDPFDDRLRGHVSEAVMAAARAEGLARA